jgi:hypothetical protein
LLGLQSLFLGTIVGIAIPLFRFRFWSNYPFIKGIIAPF